MRGKIAVVKSCHWCPYKAFDNTMGIVLDDNKMEEHNSEICYCGYYKVGYDGTQTRIEKYLDLNLIQFWTPTEDEPEYPRMPKNCPLPEGDDFRK